MPPRVTSERSRSTADVVDITPQSTLVGIGASAGGLEACKTLLAALPKNTGLAFVLIQHLDPNHESMMTDLLADRSHLSVVQAVDGMPVEAEHLYTIPPDRFLAVAEGRLKVSRPLQRHGTRLPFDFFLKSLSAEYNQHGACVVLSGTGRDGSVGIAALRAAGGYCIAQDPDDAVCDGMPRSAIATGLVHQVLPARDIPAALIGHLNTLTRGRPDATNHASREIHSTLDAIIELVKVRTSADFKSYKKGTIQRRIERRMAMAGNAGIDMDQYLSILQTAPVEVDQLGKDLLIHTTSFFRDREVFAKLQEQIIPNLVRVGATAGTIRVWVPGCSTGEEAYTLAIMLCEEIRAQDVDIQLQIFASDIDQDAVATAREGLYAANIKSDVSPERLSRFFAAEDQGYRVVPALRAAVIFTVHDVLADPPFSRLDMVSCRNLLIYLELEAQLKLISLLHFALKVEGLLLLGTAETVGRADDLFVLLSKMERVYRKTESAKAVDLGFLRPGMPAIAAQKPPHARPRPTALAEICRRALMGAYAPASVLINHRNECVYHFGPTDDYMRVASGPANHDIFAMTRPGTRARLRSAMSKARKERIRILIGGDQTIREGQTLFFDISIHPIAEGGDDLMLVCFLDKSDQSVGKNVAQEPEEHAASLELQLELEVTRSELQSVIRDYEASSENQKAVNEEALSFNEEFQSTNEELVTSKEELQSFNEELTALNGQLQETLEKQRTTSSDLQNVLYSTNVATLFLDMDLRIRFFTPATRSVFNVIPSDIGRPLTDLQTLAMDHDFAVDAREVLQRLEPLENEIQTHAGKWYHRRILPYVSHDGAIEGLVITFTDMTDRKQDAEILAAAKRLAEQATLAKSRFLAAASHDLRQPLQTLSLISGLLAQTATSKETDKLVAGLETTLAAMSGMLDTLLDINQIEAGIVRPTISTFPVLAILDRLRDEFVYNAKANSLSLRVIACSLMVESDHNLLEQMVRNLLSNALKYTTRGRVLLGCRRHGEVLRIEIWDTGAGIPNDALEAIFVEYHQLDNPARERDRGLGLGLSIVQSLGKLLDHEIRVRSTIGRGSVFSIDVKRAAKAAGLLRMDRVSDASVSDAKGKSMGLILLVEDDIEIRTLMAQALERAGHRLLVASDGVGALKALDHGGAEPDIVVADYNLPNGMDGLEVASRVLTKMQRRIPVVILTGEISTEALRRIADTDCLALNKPVQLDFLLTALQNLLDLERQFSNVIDMPHQAQGRRFTLFIVDDDEGIRDWVRGIFEAEGHRVEDYADGESFLAAYRPGREECALIDAGLPGMSGGTLLSVLRKAGHSIPVIVITGKSDVAMAVNVMKAGASDFIEKPASPKDLIQSAVRAIEGERDSTERLAWQAEAAGQIASLTVRQQQILKLVLAGSASKSIAFELGISQRTVENHRAAIMRKTGANSLPALARLAFVAVVA